MKSNKNTPVKKKYLTPLFSCVMVSQVMVQKSDMDMEEKIAQAYLYDFYGELLNEHQRRIYEDFVFQDLSLGEIADAEGISRQGVHDMVRRCRRTLEGYEEKLHLVEKFLTTKRQVEEIHRLAGVFRESHDDAVMEEIEEISNQILEEL